jgi:hypothetical protein
VGGASGVSTKQLEIDGVFRRVKEVQAEVSELTEKKERNKGVDAQLDELLDEAERYMALLLQIREELLRVH